MLKPTYADLCLDDVYRAYTYTIYHDLLKLLLWKGHHAFLFLSIPSHLHVLNFYLAQGLIS